MSGRNHPCDALVSEVANAFERIACGLTPTCQNAVTEALISAGLIRKSVRILGRDSLGLIIQHGYVLSQDAEAHWRNRQIQ